MVVCFVMVLLFGKKNHSNTCVMSQVGNQADRKDLARKTKY